MASDSLDNYFSWLPVVNTVEDRLKEDSLIHTFSYRNRIRESTKKLNKYLKTSRPKYYNNFVECKLDVLSKSKNNLDVSDDSELSDSDLKTFYSSFDDSARNLKDIHDDLFVWSLIEKKGLKIIEPVDAHNDSIWEPTVDINIPDCHSHAEDQNKFNVSLKAAGALPIKNKYPRKKYTKKIHYNTRNSSSNDSISNNTNCINIPKKTSEKHEEEEVEKIKASASNVSRNKKINGVKRNLKSAINNASLQSSENADADFTCDFIPENFQAQSTQIFSDTFTDTSIRISNQTRQVHKFSFNHANNQPRDSGIEEDSRDENTTHQNIENDERKILNASNNQEQNSLSSENSESCNDSKKKQPLKIIGDQTLAKKYKIIAKNNKVLQPIIEEKNVRSFKLNNKSNGCPNHDSESDFKSIESDDDESNGGEKAIESSNEYHDVSENYTLCFEGEKVSQSKESVGTNGRETDVKPDSQDSKHYCKKLKNESVRRTSRWVAKQYNDLKQLRLLDTSQDDSEIDLYKEDESNTTAEQQVSAENKKTPKKFTKRTRKLSNNQIKSKKEKSFVNGKSIRNLDSEMSHPKITTENFDKDANVDIHNTKKNESSSNKAERFCKIDSSSNSKLDSDNRDCSESDTANSQKSLLQNIKKLEQKKKKQKTNRSNLPSSREQSYERQTQHGLTHIVKSYKDVHSSQFIKVDDSKEEIHQNCEEDLHIGKSTKLKAKLINNDSDDSKLNIDAICSKNNSSRRNSSTSSIKDHLTSKQEKENRLKNESLTKSDNEKESEDEKTMSEHQKKKLQKLKKMDLIASDESIVSETELENDDLQYKNESSSKENEKTSENIIEKYNDEGIDNWKTTETILSRKESPSDEGNKEDDILPTQRAQKKIQQMKRLNFDDSNESKDSETETVSINKCKSQLRKSEAIKEQNNEKFEKVSRASSNEDNSVDNEMPKKERKYLQRVKKMDLVATDGSEDSDEHQVIKNISRKISNEKIKSNSIKEQTFNRKSEKIHRLSDEERSDEGDTISESQVKHLRKKKRMDLAPTGDSEDSDEGDQMLKSRSRKISDEKIKSEDSENENEKSNKKVKLHQKSNANSYKGRDNDSVDYDNDNIDITEHKVTLPQELKQSNLLDRFNESIVEGFNMSLNNDKPERYLQNKDADGLENDNDEEIDNIIPVEISKRMQQLKRLNLYEDNDSSDSDESLRNNRNVRNISQNPSSGSKKERDDSSSDEKESINGELPISTDKFNKSELNDMKKSVQDEVVDEKENSEKNMNVIIPETQESEEFLSDNIQSQEMFISLENLAESPSHIPATPKSTPNKPEREKITKITELVKQEELTKSSLEPTITLVDISDDEEIFLIDVPKHVFDQSVIGKKLVVSNGTLAIGESNYEAFEKGTSPIMSCVIKSKKEKFKTVNIRPLFSIIARRKKNADVFNENTEIKNRHKKLTTIKNQYYTKESDEKSSDEVCDAESTSTKKSNSKLPSKDKRHSLSSRTLKDVKIVKKNTAKNKKFNLINFIDNKEGLEEITGQEIASPSKISKKKLYASDNEIKDVVDSNATDESCMDAKKSSKISKKLKKVKNTVNTNKKLVAGSSKNESSLKNLNIENEIASAPNYEYKDEVEAVAQGKSKTKVKTKTKNKMEESNPQIIKERALEQIIKSQEDNKKMFENLFQDSFLLNMSAVEEVEPAKKKAKKRKNENGANGDVSSDGKIKRRKISKSEKAEENLFDGVKPKKSKKKVEKPKEEPPSVQIMKLINDAFNFSDEKLNTSSSSNESRYGALDIERVPAKKNYSSSSSNDESENKYSKPAFHVREKSKEKDPMKSTTSLSNAAPLKKEVKDEKKKIKKIYFDE